MNTTTTRRLLVSVAAGGILAGFLTVPPANAAPVGDGCVEDFWMWNGLRTATRMICDGYRLADGSWERRRGFFDNAYWTNGSSSCSSYSCTYYPPRYIPELKVIDVYPVTDATVLPDEPGYIESATPRVVS
jgi:hypothetical protein